MNKNNNENGKQYENYNSDYYFSLLDVLASFYKRKVVFISVFLITILSITIYSFIKPSVYKVGHGIKIKNDDYWSIFDYSADIPPIKLKHNNQINKQSVIEAIKYSIDNININLDKNEKIYFEMDDYYQASIFIETSSPEVESNNLLSLIESLRKQVWSDLKFKQIEMIENIVLGHVKENDSRRFISNINKESKIALLEEAHEIALKLGINDPIVNYLNETGPIFSLGANYLLAEISILKKREDDALFINFLDKNVAEINRELDYFKTLDPALLSSSEKNNRVRKIRQLELEIEHYINYAKEVRLARIAMLEESLSLAEALSIYEPLTNGDILPKVNYSKDNSFGEDLSEIDELIFFPSDESMFNNASAMGTKYLSTLIEVLKRRENNDNFDSHILANNSQIQYFENYLKKLKKIESKPFEVNEINKYKADSSINRPNLMHGFTIGIVFGLLAVFFTILLKNDLRRNDN